MEMISDREEQDRELEGVIIVIGVSIICYYYFSFYCNSFLYNLLLLCFS